MLAVILENGFFFCCFLDAKLIILFVFNLSLVMKFQVEESSS